MDVVPGDRSLSARCVAASFGALAWFAVSLRFYVRLKLKNFGWDDGLIAVALVFYTVLCACMITASHYGTGQHEANLTEESIVIALRLWWLCEVFYGLASVALKASVCIFLLRIAVRRLHVWILYTVMTVTVMTGFVFMLVLLLQCHPISHFWERDQDGGHCISWTVIIAMSWLWSIFAGMCDFTVGILPIFLVKDLQMDRRTKIAVILILGVACIASSAVIIRMPFLHTFSDPDFLWATTDIALWTNIEVGLGIFASSVATLRPLLRLFHNKGLQYSSNQYPNTSRLRSNDHNMSFKRMQSEHSGDLTTTFGLKNKAVMLTTVHSTSGGHDAHGSDSALNQTPDVQVPYGEYLVQKTFEVTATERTPAENV